MAAKLLSDDACRVCGKEDDEEFLMLCDGCDRPFHTACHQGCTCCMTKPRNNFARKPAVPEGDWFCKFCAGRVPSLGEGEPPVSSIFGWGDNEDGQLALHDTEAKVVWKPTKIHELDGIGVLDIACCETCTFVLCNDANLYSVGTGLCGQLGHQDVVHEKLLHFRLLESMTEEKRSKGEGRFSQIHAGANFGLVVTTAGHVYTWGNGECGQLGHQENKNKKVPKKISALRELEVPVELAACGGDFVIMTTKYNGDDDQFNTKMPGVFMSMGSNTQGQLGDASSKNQWVPQLLNNDASDSTSTESEDIDEPAEFLLGRDITQLATGRSHAVAVVAGTKGIWTWGYGDRGQVGHPKPVVPEGQSKFFRSQFRVPRPRFVQSFKNDAVKFVACGAQHTLVVLQDGRLFAMGDNEFGQLGIKRSETSQENCVSTPLHVAAFGVDKNIKQIGCGDDFSIALTTIGEVYSWGRNQLGQLGLGKSQTSPLDTPTKVPELPAIQKLAIGINQIFAIEFTNVTLPPPIVRISGKRGGSNGALNVSPSASTHEVMNPQHYVTYDLQQQQQLYAQGNMGVYTTQNGMITSSRDSSVPPLHMWTPPSHQELQLYDQLFTYTDDQHRNSIGGQQAVAFFMRSHLDKTVLREIWTIADSQQKSNLSRNEFYVAMRLISMAQHGEQISVQRFYQLAAMPYPLPKIEGVLPSIQIPSQVQVPAQAPVQVHAQQDVNAVHPQKPLSYALTAAEKSKYELVFQQYDTDHDGFLLGTEAVTLFQMSGLDRNILREIWSMADVTQDSKLNIQEFYVAMHLIVCLSKRGLPMPPTLPRELREAAFGAVGAGPVVPSHGFGAHVTGSPSQSGLVRQQQGSVPLPEPEGMSAFDALSTGGDAPLLSLQSSTPRSSREDSFYHNDAYTRNRQFGDGNEPSVPTPTDSVKQHDFNSFPTSRTPSVVGRDRTNSASSLSSMSSFGGLTPRPSQQPAHQLPPRNFGSNERIQMQADNPAHSALGGMSFGGLQPPVTSLEKPFMSDEDEKKLVGKLDQQNQEVAQAIASVERKQSTIEMVSEKLRDLDELRQELVTLVMKRENMRAASACNSELSDTSAEEQTRHAVERSLRSLLENQKRLVHQLQHDISRYEGELEEAILNAKLQQKLSLGSQSPLIDAATAPLSAHDSSRAEGGRTTVFSGAPLIIDGSNTLPSSEAVPNSPSFSAFSPDATDSSGFNAFSNFDSAPRSLASATPSPAGAGMIPSGSLFSPTPSPSQSASGNDTFDVFGSYAAPSSTGVVPSALPDVHSTPAKSPFSPTSSTAVVDDSAGFDAFNAAAPLSAADTGVSPSPPAAIDATSPFSPFSPSPVPAAVDDGGFSGFGDFKTAFSSLPAAVDDDGFSGFGDLNAASSSLPAAAAASSSTDFIWEPIPSDIATPVASSTPVHESSPFSPTPVSVTTETPVFDAFASAPLSNDDTTTSANTAVATEKLILSPVAADNDGLNGFGDFGAAVSTDNAVESCELVSKQESTGDLLFSPTPSPVAATENTSFDTFCDFRAPPTSSGSAVSEHASEKATGNSPFSPVAADDDDFDSFGDFNAAPASADTTAPSLASEKSSKASSNSPFSPVAEDATASDFEDFCAAPASTDTAATPSEPLTTTDSNGSSLLLSVVADSSESGDVSDPFNSASPVTIDSTKSAEVFDKSHSSPFSPGSGGFEVIEDLNATTTSVDKAKSAAEEDTSDSNGFKVHEDLSAADDFDIFN